LSVKGSDTMVILAQHWAEGFMASHEGVQVQVTGGGSGTGIAALLGGTADIASASRPMNDRERATLSRERHAEARESRVALDALAVYVHDQNPVTSLTMEQLASIYRGQVTRWSEVGGPDRPIVLYSRENNSGTYTYFKEHVLGNQDFALTAQTLPGTAAVINAVSRDPNGIGYGGIGYAEGVRTSCTRQGSPGDWPQTFSRSWPRRTASASSNRPGSIRCRARAPPRGRRLRSGPLLRPSEHQLRNERRHEHRQRERRAAARGGAGEAPEPRATRSCSDAASARSRPANARVASTRRARDPRDGTHSRARDRAHLPVHRA
jgi:hypothetical protein